MIKRVFFGLVVVAVLTSLLAISPKPETRKPVAIGALPVKGMHLIAPREDKVLKDLELAGVITDASTSAEIQSAMEGYREQFAKDTIAWVNPAQAEKALAHEQALAKSEIGVTADPPVTPVEVTIFGLTVQFEEDGTPFTGTDCDGIDVSFDGPEAGHVPAPLPGDNASIWYEPADILDLSVYHDITFGYNGAGVVRTDLNGGAGIDLTGYTVQDYYDKVSGGVGNVTLKGDFFGWVEVPHDESYYGTPTCAPNGDEINHDNAPEELVTDAADAFNTANPGFDWTVYDQDGDQIIDTFWILHAGVDQAVGGGEQAGFALWSHSSDLRYYAAYPNGYQVAGMATPADDTDDIFIGPYTMNPEIADVGVLSEEFGHNVFGLPDLYTTDAQNSVGFWAIMSAGAYGGPLAGAAPVGMPLWFRMNAWCGVDWCNWQYPMVTRGYQDALADIEIGTLEDTPAGTVKGVRVNLPKVEENILNAAGSGKGAYSGTGRDQSDVTLEKVIDVPATGTNELSLDSYWEIETDWDYGYVAVKEGTGSWTLLDDKGAYFRTTNPNGNNLGVGLTGFGGPANLKFDLSAYAGKTVTLRLWYRTDAAATELGWWIDNVMLDSVSIDDFETAVDPDEFPGWTNAVDTPWFVVPTLKYHTNYYLLEYRGNTKYDSQAKTAYVTTASADNLWTIERVPYNIPGGLLYYRNTKYPGSYSQRQWYGDPPSYGPKNKILVVDMNWDAMDIGDSGYIFNNRVAAYDATLDLDGTEAFSIPGAYGIPGGPYSFAAKPAVTRFNDTLGYTPGFLYLAPNVYYAFRDGSVVIPARGPYSSRIRNLVTGEPQYNMYGASLGFTILGSGDPGGDNVQHGVNIVITGQSAEGANGASSGTFRFYNYSLDIESSQTVELVKYGTYQYTYEIVVTNTGKIPTVTASSPSNPTNARPALIGVTLDPALTFVSSSASPVNKPDALRPVGTYMEWAVPQLDPGESVTLTIVANAPFDQAPHYIETVVEGTDGQAYRGPWFVWDEYQIFNSFLPLVPN